MLLLQHVLEYAVIHIMSVYALKSISVVVLLPSEFFIHPNQTVVVGESATISCNSSDSLPVNWWFRTSQDVVDAELCVSGRLVNGNHKWYTVNDTDYSLTIKSVTMDNGGMYTCGENEGYGDRHITWLTVLGRLM